MSNPQSRDKPTRALRRIDVGPEQLQSDKEIEQQRRAATSRNKKVDFEKVQQQRDLIGAARAETPDEFQKRLIDRGIDLNSAQGRKVMEAYWLIRRERQR